ncbi:ABC transporter ATP-binding protein [Streptomyces huiliensis]|uniref:ABC transporter ATP-binding protein n=1 Tax=Streptomyces huiliensis TaxID=2876027 RepID=UPI001CBE7DB8|nr:ABC transporter ATP-binding protein [Streptomyces huiliensis]MBZ4318586.1 ABC transporter ATP-binding protein/permease [Streptomyces huiliensis]
MTRSHGPSTPAPPPEKTPSGTPAPPTPSGARVADFVRLVVPHRAALAWSSLLTVAAALLRLAVPVLAMRAVQREGDRPVLLAALAALFVLQAGASSAGAYLLQRTSESVVLRLRNRLVPRLLFSRIGTHDTRRVGDLLSRATTDLTLIREVVMHGLVDLLTGTVTVVGAVGLMLWLDWRLFLLTVLPVTLATALVFSVLSGIRAATHRAQVSAGFFASDLERALSAIRTVKANNAEAREAERIGRHARDSYAAGVRVAALESLVSPAMELAANGSMVLVVLVGGLRAADGATTLPHLVAFLMAVMYAVMPLAAIFRTAGTIQKGLASLGRVREVESAPVEPGAGEAAGSGGPASAGRAAVPIARPPGEPPALEFRNISFAYPAEGGNPNPALSHVSFRVPPRSYCALVGLSGAGKSTVFSLVERFHEPQEGRILLHGVDVADFPSPQSVRARTALVEQNCPVLHGTLRENLVYGRPDATARDVADVLERVRLDGLVARLPRGLDSLVGEHGCALSGGERQRVAIARALLRKPALLLLDEPTSALDAVNEAALAEVVDEVSASCATLVIAHRMSTVRRAGRIVVLDAGRVVGTGSHADLVRGNSFYRALALSG